MSISKDNIKNLIVDLFNEYQADNHFREASSTEIVDLINEHLRHHFVLQVDSFHDYLDRIVCEIMDSKWWQAFLEENRRENAEIEYERRHPYRYRGVSKSMF